MKLIDKDALVAEIERRINEYKTPVDGLSSNNIRLNECKDVLSFLNTLEVKEVQEEPVSEDLEKISYYFACMCNPLKAACSISSPNPAVIKAFKAGAKWQKEQLEKNRLKHCDELTEEQAQIESDFVTQHLKDNNRTPTFIDAIEYGMRLNEEQTMKDAFECEVKVDAGGYPYIDRCIELYDYDKDVPLAKAGDKYKVVLIKEG